MGQPLLSIVIPAYNEEVRIRATLERILSFLTSCSFAWEIIVADDGSTDSTAAIVAELALKHGEIVQLPLIHKGKGWAVKNGMLAARGQYRFLCDADLAMPIEQVARFLPPQCDEGVIGVGSREAAGSRRIDEPQRRHLMGRWYNWLAQLAAVPGISDTQCGFKCFPAEQAKMLFQQQRTDGFAFDVEILFLARRAGFPIKEIGIDWYYQEHSKVRPLIDPLLMAWDLLKIRWKHRRWTWG